VESPDILDLIKILKEYKDSDFIIDILGDIIKQQMMYGGSIPDKILFQLDKAQKERVKNL
jgi:hypothetical protein